MAGFAQSGADVLPYILLATIAGGALSVIAASLVAFTFRQHWIEHLVSFAAGAMLAAAFLDLLPEAVAAGLSVEETGWVLLAGLLLFFLIEKYASWWHQHSNGSMHASGALRVAKPAGPMILVGDAFHNFADGVVVAAAFVHDPELGVATTLAVVAHEIPQEIGDFMVLLDAGFTRRRALVYNVLCSLACVAGGILGYYLLAAIDVIVPYAIALAAASFIYIAVADLIPELHNGHGVRAALPQLALIALGIAAVSVSFGPGHGAHAH